MTARRTMAEEQAAAVSLARHLALGNDTPELLATGHHTIFRLSEGVVARIRSAGSIGPASAAATCELAVARYLARHGAPVIAPLATAAGPHAIAGCIVTLWPYRAAIRDTTDADAGLAAAALARVHRAFAGFPGELPHYTAMLDRCWQVLADPSTCRELAAGDRRLLAGQFHRLRARTGRDRGGAVPLHGDAHLGNALIDAGGATWLDFEEACTGPREYDIACLPEETWAMFDGADQARIACFAELRSVTVATWCWADRDRSAAVRAAADHHLDRVRAFAR